MIAKLLLGFALAAAMVASGAAWSGKLHCPFCPCGTSGGDISQVDDVSAAKPSCCTPDAQCGNPVQACCTSETAAKASCCSKSESAAKPACCVEGAECCIPPQACCQALAHGDTKAASITLVVEGMSCQGCAGKVDKLIAKIDGVESSKADAEKGEVGVTPKKDAKVSLKEIWEAVEKAGFKPTKVTSAAGSFTEKPKD